jgi:hypothetical protein
MAKGIMKFRCCAKAASTGNRCRNKTLTKQRVTGLEWWEQPTSFCVVHTEAVITVQRWYRDRQEELEILKEVDTLLAQARDAINKAKDALKK